MRSGAGPTAMWPVSDSSNSWAPACTPSNFHCASGVAPDRASTFCRPSHPAALSGAISGQASEEGTNSVKRPGRKEGV